MAQADKQKGAAPAKKKAGAGKPRKTAKKAHGQAAAGNASASPAAAGKAAKPKPSTSAKTAPAQKPRAGDAARPKKPAASSGASRGAKMAPRLPHLDKKTLGALIAKLRELREESQRMVNMHFQADLQQREEGGDVGDDMDQASNERDREFSLLIHQRHLRRLKQINEAFERIDDGSYGLCEGTEEPINPKRLLIMPLARYSLEYQQQQEKMLGRSPEDGMSAGDDSLISDE